ncbi:MAG: amino acid permease, partial [Candidatus Latescibacteria bacterium]|nr:amino acid permease [Candidatus Latescibacterota bacterium]
MTGNRKLVRGLTLYDSTSIVICSIIGTGVFLKTGIMAQYTGSPLLVMAAWMAAGLLSLAGALTYAELGAMLPKAGGDYVYLQTAYGEGVAFLYGWMYITVGASGAAALAAAFAMFLASTFPIGTVWIERTIHLFGHEVFWQFGIKQVVAIAAIIFCGALNCAGVSFSGSVQSFITTIKVLGVLAVIALVFLFSKEATWENLVPYTEAPRWCGIKAFGAAMLASLWAYNGWTFLGLVAGEVKKPEKNIPRAIITGMLVVLVVYMLANLSYFYALPFDEVMTSNSTM